jgi:tetratricopeptide (TPR) repeat protein
MMPNEIPTEAYDSIKRLCSEGDGFFNAEKYPDAVEKYRQALKLIPLPIENYEAATWVWAAIGDAYFSMRNFSESADAFFRSLNCPGALENPFIYLRLGQSFFEAGQLERAANELTKAYMLGGREIFNDEEPKYFEYLKTQIRAPESGVW